ncbi:MAG: HD-GYP domain-containing protein [Candidatus Latescibacterota bacterium]|jgi:HD-GYP domain-containing protein (c-di-GMP phosphodiesterase class II)
MKKLIAIDQLQVGMFLEAEPVTEYRDGQEVRYLSALKAVNLGIQSKRARLTGRMHEKIAQDGGLLLTSPHQIGNLRETGLTMVTIDTDKGADLPPDVKPLTDPDRRPPPPGRLVHYDEEIERAQEIREETTSTLRTSLEDVASGKDLDVEKVHVAGSFMAESILRNVDAMVSLTRLKKHDPYTAMHCMNVCTLVTAMALHDGVDHGEIPMITTAALLHDVGKTRVPLEVLNKPGRFEPHELEEMRKHAAHSGDIMRETGGFSDDAIAIATQHHEMLNGSGYPLQLKGEEIHWYARMTAVADVYDALTAKRVYKPAMPMYQALLRIHKNKGTEFDERVVDLFVKTLGLYPVGTLVELNNRERGIVYEPNPQDSRKPTLGLFTMANEKARAAPLVVNLALRSEAEGREIAKALDPEREGIDVEEWMQAVAQRGERGERRRREG